MGPRAEYEFQLPHGYVDAAGEVHRVGQMRTAFAIDEIEAIAHPRVQDNEAYLPIVLLSRVITRLGTLTEITPQVIETLYAADLAYLEDLYLYLNSYEGMVVQTQCPHCNASLRLQITPPDEND